jgi:hypothetical protein
MKLKVFVSLFITALCCSTVTAQQNTLTDQEKKDGWTLLFDGQSFGQWRKYNGDAMPEQWSIDAENGAMKLVTNARRPGAMSGADIIFGGKKFSNFEVSIDWMIERRGNSGILYYVVEEQGMPMYNAAPEVQVLDNTYASDNALTNHLAGSLYDIRPAMPINAKENGQWNNIIIKVNNGHVTHVQNGVKVCEYTLWTPEWAAMVAKSKFKDWPGFHAGPAKEGYIGLQDHGFAVWYRNIKIREL